MTYVIVKLSSGWYLGLMKKLKSLFIIGIVVLASGAVYLTACRKKVIEPKPIKQSYFTGKVDGVDYVWQIDYSNWISNIDVYTYNPFDSQSISVRCSQGNLTIHLSNEFEEPYTYEQTTNGYSSAEPFYIVFNPTMEADPDPYCDYGVYGNNTQHGYRSYFMLNYYNHYGVYPNVPEVPEFHIEVNNADVIEGSFDASMLNVCYADSTELGVMTITDAKFKFYRKDFETTDPF